MSDSKSDKNHLHVATKKTSMKHQRRTCCGGTRPSQNWLILSVKLFNKIKKNLSWKFSLMLGEKQALCLWSSRSMSASGRTRPDALTHSQFAQLFIQIPVNETRECSFFFQNICRCDGKGCLLKYKRGFCFDGTPPGPLGGPPWSQFGIRLRCWWAAAAAAGAAERAPDSGDSSSGCHPRCWLALPQVERRDGRGRFDELAFMGGSVGSGDQNAETSSTWRQLLRRPRIVVNPRVTEVSSGTRPLLWLWFLIL